MEREEEDEDKKGDLTEDTEEGKPILFVSPWMGGMSRPYQRFVKFSWPTCSMPVPCCSDLGRPWNVINPIIGNSFGVSSVQFLVAWHFLLYMIAQLIEFSPAIAEWLGARKARKILSGMTVAAVIFRDHFVNTSPVRIWELST